MEVNIMKQSHIKESFFYGKISNLKKMNNLNKLIIVISFCMFLFFSPKSAQAAWEAVPTFNSVGLSWKHNNGSTNNECEVLYRKLGNANWNQALSLWFDTNNSEYRGSIVNLTPGTAYEVKLTLLSTDDTVTLTSETWSETFNVGATTTLDASIGRTYTIGTSGSPGRYHLYDGTANSTVIDVNNSGACINVGDHEYIIIRGVKCIDAQNKGIIIGKDANDVVIEDCEITNWGTKTSEDAAISFYGVSYVSNAARVVIQRNKIYSPRNNADTWEDGYPTGSDGIHANSVAGPVVIRYNSIYGDSTHRMEDGIGGWDNFARFGSVGNFGANTDIYGNYITHCNDDGIELEGNNENNRIWGNYIKTFQMGIAVYTTAVGPLYIFRNIIEGTDTTDWADGYYRGGFLKTGASASYDTDGRIFVFHNTMLRPPYSNYLVGMGVGLGSGYNLIDNMVSRNNILHTLSGGSASNLAIYDTSAGTYNDYDYDLYNGTCGAEYPSCGSHESNGISGTEPSYDPTPTYNLAAPGGKGTFSLKAGTPGHDDGVVIENFNDGYEGNAPDIGAHERGLDNMEFGVTAYLESPQQPPNVPAPPKDLMIR
jgi:hypothetical protein